MKIIHPFIFPFTKKIFLGNDLKVILSYLTLIKLEYLEYKYHLLFVKYGILHYHKTITFDMVLFNKHIGKPGKIYVFGSWLHLALNAI